jgi:hypothetical protein
MPIDTGTAIAKSLWRRQTTDFPYSQPLVCAFSEKYGGCGAASPRHTPQEKVVLRGTAPQSPQVFSLT